MDASELAHRLAEFSQATREVLRDVKEVTDEQTKHWIVNPFLMSLGWDPHDKHEVYLDYPTGADFPPADYALLSSDGKPRVIIEVHRPSEGASEGEAAARIAKSLQAPLALVTNGQEFSLWYVADDGPATPLLAITLGDLADNADALVGLTAEYRGSDTGVQQLRRAALRSAVIQLLEENADRTFDALTDWVQKQLAPEGTIDAVTHEAIREATLLWLTEEHRKLPGFQPVGGSERSRELRTTHVRDWEPFPRGPAGTFMYKYDSAKILDVRQSAKEVREALRLQGLRTSSATAFGGFYGSLRHRAGLQSG
jgi:hypothetical protein